MKKNTEITRSMKLKFLLILLLSNSSMALICSSSAPTLPSESINTATRIGYVTLRISASLKTELTTKPVIISNKNQTIIIKDAFIIKKIESQHEEILESPTSQFLIELKKEDFQKLSMMNTKLIYPYQLNLNTKARRSHEIHF